MQRISLKPLKQNFGHLSYSQHMAKDFLNGKTVLVTGGTGSFGRSFVHALFSKHKVKKVIVFSRDEFKQYHMEKELQDERRLRFFLGDIRDISRLRRAFVGVDVVVHAAALKQVPALEYNPFEAVKTNVIGTQNVIEAALDQKVKRVLLISTDKAAYPGNLYGATKLCAERLFVAANSYAGRQTIFSVVRYGNVIGSRGSFIETLLKNKKEGKKVKITDPEMTRFWISLEQAYELVMFALRHMEGGEIFIPKIPSMKIGDVVEAIFPKAKKEIVGLRSGEKKHEVLLTDHEARHAVDFKRYYVVLPEFHFWSGPELYRNYLRVGKKFPIDFSYESQNNEDRLTVQSLRKLLTSKLL